MTPPVLRICASYAMLPREDCAVPERCVERACSDCGTSVHYDPKSSIPVLGPERIVCGSCFETIVERLPA